MAPNGCCSYEHTLFVAPSGSLWLPVAPNDSHRVSLLLDHYPKANLFRFGNEIVYLHLQTPHIAFELDYREVSHS